MLPARILEYCGDNQGLKARLANRSAESVRRRSKIQLALRSTSWKLTEPLKFVCGRFQWPRQLTQKGGAGRLVLKVLASPYLETSEQNPGLLLLYRSMENLGVQVTNFTVRQLLFESWDIWHLHWPEFWPEILLCAPKTSNILLRLFKFWVKLKLARIKNTKIFWTVHNLRPHERDRPLLERLFWWIFLPSVDGVICMSHSSRQLLYDQHPRVKNHPIFIIPRGHYRGAYPDSMSREEARSTMRVKSDEFVATFLGQIRPYKGIPQLIRCFNASGLTSSRLIIAGRPISSSIGQELKELASGNPTIELFLDFVDNADVQKFLRAADLVVLPYTDILNSGSAILALSFDRPVLLPARGIMADLREAVGPDWVRLYEGELTPDIIRDTAQWAVKRRNCSPRTAPLGAWNWDIAAKLTVEAFSSQRQR
jgi:beta-1,4-mannosyltransferase